MTYQELTNKLNEKYNTNIFYSNYNLEIDNKQADIKFKSKLNEEFYVNVDVETLEFKKIFTFIFVDFSTIESIAKGNQQDEVDKLKVDIKFLESENKDLKNSVSSHNAIKDFAQDTILKAIKGF